MAWRRGDDAASATRWPASEAGGCPRGESSVGKTTGATGAIAGTNMIAMIATTIAVAIGATNVRAGGIFFALTERHGIHRAVRACGFIARPSTQVGAKQCVVLQPPKKARATESRLALLKGWTQITLGRSEWVQLEQLQSSARARGVEADHTVP